MSALTEFTIPADAVALEQSFHRAPALRVELVRTVACDEDLSFLRSSGVPASTATDALEAAVEVDAVSRLTDDTARALHTVEWNGGPEPLLESLAADGGVLEAVANQGRWHVTTIHPDHESVTTAYHSCEAPVKVRSVRTLSDDLSRVNGTLTDSQYEALSSALAHGFYDIPRDVTLADLATDLGVSHQAVSERLRRSHRTLARDAIE